MELRNSSFSIFAWATYLGLLACMGCGPKPTPTTPIALEVGSGEWQFEAVSEDGESPTEVTLAAGSQGGFHVWVSLRTPSMLELSQVDVELRTQIVGSNVPPERSHVRLDFRGDATGSRFLGWPAQLLQPGCARGQIVEIWARIRDRNGKTGDDSARVRVSEQLPPGVPACREGI